jgi:hypothetical protein
MSEQISDPGETRRRQTRFRAYWASSVLSTFVFLFLMFVMMMVPGILASDKLGMLSISAIALTASLCIGAWKFDGVDAPIAAGPTGAAVAVILLIELGICAVGMVGLVVHPER